MHYNKPMSTKTVSVQIRLSVAEKLGFEQAAELAGIPISAWVRERLRLAAIRELEGAGRHIPFIPEVPFGGKS
jgi:hypothetical protein